MLPTARWDLETFVKMSTTPVRNLIKESQQSEHKFSKVGIILPKQKQGGIVSRIIWHYLGFNGKKSKQKIGTKKL